MQILLCHFKRDIWTQNIPYPLKLVHSITPFRTQECHKFAFFGASYNVCQHNVKNNLIKDN